MNLREIRIMKGLGLCEVAQAMDIPVISLTYIEQGRQVPTLPEIVAAEQYFDQPLEWDEPLSNDQKVEVCQDFLTLAARYPVESVVLFMSKSLKNGRDTKDPGYMISTYARMIMKTEDDILTINPE